MSELYRDIDRLRMMSGSALRAYADKMIRRYQAGGMSDTDYDCFATNLRHLRDEAKQEYEAARRILFPLLHVVK